MTWLLLAGGVVLTALPWVLSRRGISLWWTTATVYGLAGAAAILTGAVEWSPRVRPAVAAAVGPAAGLLLYVGTRAFVAIVSRWPAFRRHVAEVYDQRRGVTLGTGLALVLLLVAPGEEVFWRGLVRSRAAEETSRVGGAVVAWAGYVAGNAAAWSLPILAGAVVGGAAWTALAVWTGGVLAPIGCHAVWTGLMFAVPPKEAAP